jgi:hypothetical protein
MAFKSGAQGINSKGKTKGKQLGIDGAKLPIDGGVSKGGKASSVKSIDMKKMGRNLARAANQRKGK